MSAMTKFKCPTCGNVQTVRAEEVAHRCPKARQNKITYYKRVENDEHHS